MQHHPSFLESLLLEEEELPFIEPVGVSMKLTVTKLEASDKRGSRVFRFPLASVTTAQEEWSIETGATL